MKKLVCLLLVLSMAVSLSACGLFTAPTTEPTTTAPTTTAASTAGSDPEPSATQSTAPAAPAGVQITENYFFAEPEDIEYDTRYVIYCDANTPSVAGYASYGVTAMYTIIYAKEEKPVASYDFMICDTADNAATLTSALAAVGQNIQETEDPCVRYAKTEGETMEANIAVYLSMSMITDDKVSTYVTFYLTLSGGVLQN